jgi:hypothetical protein
MLMRMSLRTSRVRVLMVTMCLVLSGSAFAVAGAQARAATDSPAKPSAAVNTVTVTAPAREQSWVRIPISVQVKAADSEPAQTLTYSATGLPAGLSINPATGVISGTPQRITVMAATVTATDASGATGSASIRWAVGWAITIPDPGKVTTAAGLAVNVLITYTNAAGARDRVTLWATGLPAGMAFRQNPAEVYGWPATVGDYKVTIHAKGSEGDIDWMTFPLVVRTASGGPAGRVRLALNGKCLTDPGNKTANGTRVDVSNCQAGPAQRWTVVSDGTLRVRGRCLDIAGSGGAAGQRVQLWQCTGAPREIWMQGTAGELVNPSSGLCLTGPGSVPTTGTCRIKADEAWTLPGHQVLASVTNTCMDDLHSVGTNGNPIDMFSCNGTPVQDWTFEPDGSIRVYGNKCVTVRTPGRAGAKVELWACTAANRRGQDWAIVRTGGVSSELSIGGVCLAIPSMTAAGGSQLVMARCTATDPRVHWRVW